MSHGIFTFVINYIDKLTSGGEEKIQDEEWRNVLKQAIVFFQLSINSTVENQGNNLNETDSKLFSDILFDDVIKESIQEIRDSFGFDSSCKPNLSESDFKNIHAIYWAKLTSHLSKDCELISSLLPKGSIKEIQSECKTQFNIHDKEFGSPLESSMAKFTIRLDEALRIACNQIKRHLNLPPGPNSIPSSPPVEKNDYSIYFEEESEEESKEEEVDKHTTPSSSGRSIIQAQALASSKVDVNSQDNLGNTLIHYAIQKGHLPYVITLINNGARLDLQNKKGETPLETTDESGNTIFHLLARTFGKDEKAYFKLIDTVMNCARGYSNDLEMVKRSLLRTNKDEKTPYEIATETASQKWQALQRTIHQETYIQQAFNDILNYLYEELDEIHNKFFSKKAHKFLTEKLEQVYEAIQQFREGKDSESILEDLYVKVGGTSTCSACPSKLQKLVDEIKHKKIREIIAIQQSNFPSPSSESIPGSEMLPLHILMWQHKSKSARAVLNEISGSHLRSTDPLFKGHLPENEKKQEDFTSFECSRTPLELTLYQAFESEKNRKLRLKRLKEATRTLGPILGYLRVKYNKCSGSAQETAKEKLDIVKAYYNRVIKGKATLTDALEAIKVNEKIQKKRNSYDFFHTPRTLRLTEEATLRLLSNEANGRQTMRAA
ncbi:ankyrin repeat domain-containing protein [Coxiella burnetii]|uniref:ankyrin repeat domain-containing protein n=1 Tax=Coxiella burnetii TaxID=777 RepID=UPI0000DAE291|nr:ankyrin repeat domain-containing protein [Coxiella burnetii]